MAKWAWACKLGLFATAMTNEFKRIGISKLLALVANFSLAAFASQGKASIVTPLTALYPVMSVPIAICFLGGRVGPREAIGILLALVSVAMLSRETPAHDPAQSASVQAIQPAR